MKAADAKKRYSMSLLVPKEPDPKNLSDRDLAERANRPAELQQGVPLAEQGDVPAEPAPALHGRGEGISGIPVHRGVQHDPGQRAAGPGFSSPKTLLGGWKVIENPGGEPAMSKPNQQPAVRRPPAQTTTKPSSPPR